MIRLKLDLGAELPKYATKGSAGVDLEARGIIALYKGTVAIEGDKLEKVKKSFLERGYIKLRAFERVLFDTGLTLAQMDSNLELQIRSRSGMALKRGLIVMNQPGTIDSDYRGSIGVIIQNSTPFLNEVKLNERIAQAVASEVFKCSFEKTEEVEKTDRGSGGFGSTGASYDSENRSL